MLLSRSLVSSVVVHDLEIVEGITEAQGRRLEHVQMQGLRRATHTVRFDAKSAKPSDEDIRRRTGVPSVESVQRSRRLLHLACVQAGHFGALRAMLQSCPGRWGHEAQTDLACLAAMPQCAALPHPLEQPGPWVDLMAQRGWKGLARLLRSPTTRWAPRRPPELVDREAPGAAGAVEAADLHVCDLCPPGAAAGFDSARALREHQRGAHGIRSEFNFYVRICPEAAADRCVACTVCGSAFASPWKAIQHVGRAGSRCLASIRAGARRRSPLRQWRRACSAWEPSAPAAVEGRAQACLHRVF